MELEGREEAKHGLRHLECDGGKTFVFGGLGFGQAIKPTAEPFKLADRGEACQDDARNACRRKITRTQQAFLAGQFEDADSLGAGVHCAESMFHLFVECKYMTNIRNIGVPAPPPNAKSPTAMAGLSARTATKIGWLLDLDSNQGPADSEFDGNQR